MSKDNTRVSRNINIFYIYKFMSGLELTVSIFVLFFLVNGLSMREVMVLEALFMALVFLLEVPSGGFADLFGRKLSMILSELIGAVGFLVIGLGSSFYQFLIGQLLIGVGVSLGSGSDTSLIYDSLKENKKSKDFSKVLGRGSSLWMIALGITSVISSIIANFIDYRFLFYLTALLFILAAMLLTLIKEPKYHKDQTEKNYIKHLKESTVYVLKHKTVRDIISFHGPISGMSHLLYFLIPLFFSLTGESSIYVGVALSCYFVFVSVGNFIAHKLLAKFKFYNILILIPYLSSFVYILLFVSNRMIGIVLISLLSFVTGVRGIYVNKAMHDSVKSHQRATIASVKNMYHSIFYIIFSLIIGTITDLFSVKISFLFMGIFLLLMSVFFSMSIKKKSFEKI